MEIIILIIMKIVVAMDKEKSIRIYYYKEKYK
jgi:hypothetical protein